MTEAWQRKCDGIDNMTRNIKQLTKAVSDDLLSKNEKTQITALVVRVIMRTSERVGNDVSAANGHFGVTGFKRSHVKHLDSKGYMTLAYIAKSGVPQTKHIDLGVLATRVLIPLTKRPNVFLFQTADKKRVTRKDVNAYLAKFGVTAKDIRCYNCNLLMIQALENRAQPLSPKVRKEIFLKELKQVAAFIGHGASTLRTHYLMRRIEEEFLKTGSVSRDVKC